MTPEQAIMERLQGLQASPACQEALRRLQEAEETHDRLRARADEVRGMQTKARQGIADTNAALTEMAKRGAPLEDREAVMQRVEEFEIELQRARQLEKPAAAAVRAGELQLSRARMAASAAMREAVRAHLGDAVVEAEQEMKRAVDRWRLLKGLEAMSPYTSASWDVLFGNRKDIQQCHHNLAAVARAMLERSFQEEAA